MRFFFGGLLVLCCFFSCSDKNENKIDVSDIQVDFAIKRYDQDFYTSNKETLPELKVKYPYLFPKSFSDSLALAKINDKDEQELFNEVQKQYKDIAPIEEQIVSLFKYVKYYNSRFNPPNIVTMLSNIDYDSRVIYADSLLLISLDVYLGKDHPFYVDFPNYIKENNTTNHIIVDVANSIINTQIPPSTNRRFIDKMIYEGKKMYLLDKYLPKITDKEKAGYTTEKLAWAKANEEEIWMYFIEKKLLFSTDTKLNKRFLDNAPFSKFYMSQDNLSPGSIGVWVGWQIVRSFMQYNDVSLQKLLQLSEEEIFQKSKYKPRN